MNVQKLLLFVVVVVANDIVLRGKLQFTGGHVLTARWPTASKQSASDPRTVQVSGPVTAIGKELLLMYFENEAKSGGGDIEDIQIFDDNAAYITFESSEGTLQLVFSIFVSFEFKAYCHFIDL